jgi:parvulin-like peptidyl-prolyl isomerase
VISTRIAEYARRNNYDEDPIYRAERKTFIETALYAEQRNKLRLSVPVPTDEELAQYYQDHPDEFDIPELRRLVEVLLETREEAEEVLLEAQTGRDMGMIANERTIRPGYRDMLGRFAPIRRGEFGALGEAVFETELNEIGPIVETPLGFSVFKVIHVIPARLITLEEVRDDLRNRLYQEERQAVVDRFVEQEWRQARIWKDHERLRSYAGQISTASASADSNGLSSAPAPGSSEPPR